MTISKIGIVGAGIMGGEIAYVYAQAGIPVVMKDVEERFLVAAEEKVRSIFSSKVKRRRMTDEEMNSRLALLETTLEYGPLSGADVIIEAVPEILQIKQNVFAELEKECPDSVLASNTSALSITAIASSLSHPENAVGMHFFNPVSMMRLVEIIAGEKTSQETIEAVRAASEVAGKAPVLCGDSAGFIVNRLLCAAMMEAIRCEEEGILPREEIDRCLVKPAAGLPVGLFRMADQLGIDLLFKVMTILENAFGDRMRVPGVIRAMYDKGTLGLKTGSGFYDHSGQPAPASVDIPEAAAALVVSRVLSVVVAEARRVLKEGVAAAEDIDTAMTYGALFKKPPFKYTEEIGQAAMDAALADFAARYGGQFEA